MCIALTSLSHNGKVPQHLLTQHPHVSSHISHHTSHLTTLAPPYHSTSSLQLLISRFNSHLISHLTCFTSQFSCRLTSSIHILISHLASRITTHTSQFSPHLLATPRRSTSSRLISPLNSHVSPHAPLATPQIGTETSFSEVGAVNFSKMVLVSIGGSPMEPLGTILEHSWGRFGC